MISTYMSRYVVKHAAIFKGEPHIFERLFLLISDCLTGLHRNCSEPERGKYVSRRKNPLDFELLSYK